MKYKIIFRWCIFLFALLVLSFGHVTPSLASPVAQDSEPTPELTAEEHIQKGNDLFGQAALALEPGNLDVTLKLGQILIDLGEYNLAIAHFETVLASEPESIPANGGLCVALAFSQPVQGETQCRVTLERDPNNPDIQNGLGIALILQQKADEALVFFQNAIDIDPQHEWAHNNLGKAYLDTGNFEQAILELNEAIVITPENDTAYYNLGLAYALQDKYEQAAPQYEKAVELNPTLAGAFSDLGLIYKALGQEDKAIVAFQRYLLLRPDDPNRAEIVDILAEMGAEPINVFVRARIAFVSMRDGNMEIYSMNTDGTQLVRLTDNPAYDTEPHWSPDGTRILFSSDRNGNFDIYSMATDGSGVVQLTDDPGNDSMPAWSPDGGLIAFVSDRSGTMGIYTMNGDGSQQTDSFVHDEFTIYAPTWSFANNVANLGFVSDAQGAFDLFVFDGATKETAKLTEDYGDVLTPDWAPNGNYIVFSANPEGNFELFFIRPDGTDFFQITESDFDEYRPRWSPDSEYILYSTGLKESSEIEIRNVDGDILPLTFNNVFDGVPAWGPMDE
jgi:Tol biopolymer transport system component/Flp pilus assembly protein TadD